MAHTHPAETAPIEPDTTNMFREPIAAQLLRFARFARPHVARLDAILRRHLHAKTPTAARDPRQQKALSLITAGAAVRLVSLGRPPADFFEQVAYNSRRLAKLNVPPIEVVDALGAYDSELDRLLGKHYPRQLASLEAVRQQLHFRILLAINNAYYQVRESETQAFYSLLRAEMDATSLDDMLRRFIVILTRTFKAQAGRLIPLTDRPPLASGLLKRLARPLYIAAGSPEEELILDQGMRGALASYWSIPFFSDGRLAGLIQFGFRTAYRWLPRELDLLNAFAERCLRGAERTRLMEELAAREQQVRSLAAHLLQAEEAERHRLSRELHDEAGQSMLFLRLHLEMIEKSAPPELRQKLAEARGVTERIIAEVRRIIAALTPSAVEELGLDAAIRHLSARFRKLNAIKLRLRLAANGVRLPREAEITIYRIVQECYQNIAKHSGASHVNLLMRSTDRLLELNVADDGVGFEVERAMAQAKSFGLKGMRERVALLGGSLEITSSPGHGAKVSMRLPIPRS
ncbi:MAG TPA: sensor histidine kinase [Bryobacteraceae bacterium]|nr:sensor histidine kinase [Bryobacteraceae bacterium]